MMSGLRLALGWAAAIAILPGAGVAAETAPYAGQQGREIKALSSTEIADFEAGRGMGMAKAAELNHYPGPAHVIELRDRLRLSPQQRAAVEAIFARMSAAAKPLGAELVARERTLDAAFRTGEATPATVATATAEIGAVQGRLRAVHLAAHLETRALLSAQQIGLYEELRGYGGSDAVDQHHHQQR
jgi:LTXXQ motif family protein